MAWDFSTEPEFEEKLSWTRGFVRDEFIPLETLDMDAAAFSRATGPLKEDKNAAVTSSAPQVPFLSSPSRAGNYVTSCNLRVFADEAAEPVPAQNVHTGHSARCMHASCGRVLLQHPVGPVRIVYFWHPTPYLRAD